MIKKKKEYYSLVEVIRMVDLKSRMVKYRMVKVKEKYKDNPKLLWKSNKEWRIHESIIFEFDRQKLSEKEKENVYRTLVTVSPEEADYDVECLVEVANQIYKELSKTQSNLHLYYFIHRGLRSQRTHFHFITNLSVRYSTAIERASRKFIETNVDVRPIHQYRELLDYLDDEALRKGYLGNGKCICTIVDAYATCNL